MGEKQRAMSKYGDDGVLGPPPKYIPRLTACLFGAILLTFLFTSWFVKYPDIVISSITLKSDAEPVSIVTRSDGRIQALFVRDRQVVEAGERIAVIENAANYQDVLQLDSCLRETEILSSDTVLHRIGLFDHQYGLGELQPAYAAYDKACIDIQRFIDSRYLPHKITSTETQIAVSRLCVQRLDNDAALLARDVQISHSQLRRDSILYRRMLLSEADLERAASASVQKEYTLENARTMRESARMQCLQLESALLDLRSQYQEERCQLWTTLRQTCGNLAGQIDSWKQRYLLMSPIKGVVSFSKYWSANRNVTTGSTVVTVVPQKAANIIGLLSVPASGAGKVRIGQRVTIKVSQYPYIQFGVLRGTIRSKSPVQVDDVVIAQVSLDHGLRTNLGKQLIFVHDMGGVAEIVTDDLRLIERLVDPIRYGLKTEIVDRD